MTSARYHQYHDVITEFYGTKDQSSVNVTDYPGAEYLHMTDLYLRTVHQKEDFIVGYGNLLKTSFSIASR